MEDDCITQPQHLSLSSSSSFFLSLSRFRDTIGPQGQPVRFNKDGDAYGSYSFYQYQRHGGKYDYVRIGDWSAS